MRETIVQQTSGETSTNSKRDFLRESNQKPKERKKMESENEGKAKGKGGKEWGNITLDIKFNVG